MPAFGFTHNGDV